MLGTGSSFSGLLSYQGSSAYPILHGTLWGSFYGPNADEIGASFAASGGDAAGLNHDCPPASSSDNAEPASGNGRSGGSSSAPTPSRRPHLGWQSLLPGSIQ